MRRLQIFILIFSFVSAFGAMQPKESIAETTLSQLDVRSVPSGMDYEQFEKWVYREKRRYQQEFGRYPDWNMLDSYTDYKWNDASRLFSKQFQERFGLHSMDELRKEFEIFYDVFKRINQASYEFQRAAIGIKKQVRAFYEVYGAVNTPIGFRLDAGIGVQRKGMGFRPYLRPGVQGNSPMPLPGYISAGIRIGELGEKQPELSNKPYPRAFLPAMHEESTEGFAVFVGNEKPEWGPGAADGDAQAFGLTVGLGGTQGIYSSMLTIGIPLPVVIPTKLGISYLRAQLLHDRILKGMRKFQYAEMGDLISDFEAQVTKLAAQVEGSHYHEMAIAFNHKDLKTIPNRHATASNNPFHTVDNLFNKKLFKTPRFTRTRQLGRYIRLLTIGR